MSFWGRCILIWCQIFEIQDGVSNMATKFFKNIPNAMKLSICSLHLQLQFTFTITIRLEYSQTIQRNFIQLEFADSEQKWMEMIGPIQRTLG